MSVLIDTSAWIEFLRPKGDAAIKARVAELLGANQASYTCPVAFELLAGARPAEVADVKESLDLAHRLVVEPAHWDAAAQAAATLRARGVTVPASDLLIATVAVGHRVALLARDKHFGQIQAAVLPKLRLV